MAGNLVFDEDYEELIYCQVSRARLECIICIDSTVLGPALGGTRFYPYANFEAAKIDAIRLARGMTYKALMLWHNCELPPHRLRPQLRLGGGKAVIIGDPNVLKTPELFFEFGWAVNRLMGRFITGEDMNIKVEDVELIGRATEFVVGRSRAAGTKERGKAGNPAEYTALGCMAGQRAAMQFYFKSRKFEGRRLVFQGAGEVGFRHARFAREQGARIVACDTDPDKIRRIRDEVGAEIVDPDKIYEAPGDIFVPSAIGGTVNAETIPLIQCPIIAGCANNQLADPRTDGELLMKRRILYAVDFVLNAGGLRAVADEMAIDGFRAPRVLEDIEEGIYRGVLELLEKSNQTNRPPQEIAEEFCQDKLEAIRQSNGLEI